MSSQSQSSKLNLSSLPIYDDSEDEDFIPNYCDSTSSTSATKRQREERSATKTNNLKDPFPAGLDDEELIPTSSKKVSEIRRNLKIHDRSLSPELDILPSKKAKIVNVYGSPKKLAISTQIIPTDPSSKEVFTILSSNNSATVSSFRPQVKWNEKEIDQLKKLKASEPNRPFYDIAMLIGNGKTVAQCKVKWAEISNRMIEASEGGNLIRRNTAVDSSPIQPCDYKFDTTNSERPMSAPVKRKSKGSMLQIPTSTTKSNTSLRIPAARLHAPDHLMPQPSRAVLNNQGAGVGAEDADSSTPLLSLEARPSSQINTSTEEHPVALKSFNRLASPHHLTLAQMNKAFAVTYNHVTSANSIEAKSTTPPGSPPPPSAFPSLLSRYLPPQKTFTSTATQTIPKASPSNSIATQTFPSLPAPVSNSLLTKSVIKKRLEQDKESKLNCAMCQRGGKEVTYKEYEAAIGRILAVNWD